MITATMMADCTAWTERETAAEVAVAVARSRAMSFARESACLRSSLSTSPRTSPRALMSQTSKAVCGSGSVSSTSHPRAKGLQCGGQPVHPVLGALVQEQLRERFGDLKGIPQCRYPRCAASGSTGHRSATRLGPLVAVAPASGRFLLALEPIPEDWVSPYQRTGSAPISRPTSLAPSRRSRQPGSAPRPTPGSSPRTRG